MDCLDVQSSCSIDIASKGKALLLCTIDWKFGELRQATHAL